MNLFEDIYDGELNFEIENYTIEPEYISMDLLSEYQEKTVGLQVKVPIQTKKILFKNIILPDTSRTVQFLSLGERSDQLITALDEIWHPDFEVDGKFDPNGAEIEYAILNKEMFDCMKDKTYTRLYYQIDMETGDEFDNFNLEIGFNFNLDRKRASFVERKRETRNDLIAILMA